jgi:hypothetical protein
LVEAKETEMKASGATLLMAALALAACEDGAPERQRTVVRAANPPSDQLKGMSDNGRRLGLYRAVRDSGQRCKRVDAAAYQQEYKNMAMWVARCSDSGDWAVFIAPNGDVQARGCRHAGTLGLPECRLESPKP